MEVQLKNWGNSQGIRFSKEFLKSAGIQAFPGPGRNWRRALFFQNAGGQSGRPEYYANLSLDEL